MTVGSAAVAAVVLHGKKDLVSEPLSGGLQVVAVKLEPMLVPGRSADLVVDLRNRSATAVRTDRVSLALPLRVAKPAGCTAKVSGPLMASGGISLPEKQRITLGPGAAGRLVVPGGLKLASSATGGCGFQVQVDVRATQDTAVPITRPPSPSPSRTVAPTPTSSPTSRPPITPPPSTSRPPTMTPPPSPDPEVCDPEAGCSGRVENEY